uniref:Uncharacterized protein LOC114333963 n=1 Tax=Diabrotica virgifera virgifera TaxID=50390 RepID=A0A6P7G5H0_DIAVI
MCVSNMKDIACVIIYLYLPVLILCRPNTGEIIEIELPNRSGFDVDLSAVTRLLNTEGAQNVIKGAQQFLTQVNGKPVTIEIIDAGQMPNHQTSNSQTYWSQQNFNRQQWPQRTHQRPQSMGENVYITKDTRYSNDPNIEVYDVYTGEQPIHQRYPNRRYPNGQLIPVGPIRTYPDPNVYPPNHNRYPYDGRNPWNTNIYDNSRLNPTQPTNKPRPHMMHHHHHSSPRPAPKDTSSDESIIEDSTINIDLSKDQNTSEKPKKPDSNNVDGYIDKFPVILLNENEIRK